MHLLPGSAWRFTVADRVYQVLGDKESLSIRLSGGIGVIGIGVVLLGIFAVFAWGYDIVHMRAMTGAIRAAVLLACLSFPSFLAWAMLLMHGNPNVALVLLAIGGGLFLFISRFDAGRTGEPVPNERKSA